MYEDVISDDYLAMLALLEASQTTDEDERWRALCGSAVDLYAHRDRRLLMTALIELRAARDEIAALTGIPFPEWLAGQRASALRLAGQ